MSAATRRATALAVALVLGACGGPRAGWRPPPPTPVPKVVVLVVIDQLSEEAFARKLEIAEAGFPALLARGTRYVARLPYAASATAPGHAALSTGAPPLVTGIIGNEWWDRALGREVRAAEDPDGGLSGARLRVDGIADVLARGSRGSRAIGVAFKDRSAILGLGRSGEPVWFDRAQAVMVGATGAPAWLGSLADPAAVQRRMGATWTPSLPAARLAALSGGPDDAPGELAIDGWTASFPHDLAAATRPPSALATSPAGNRLVIDAALAALADLDLADGATDYLLVSLSAHDYIVHAFGPDSWEAWDAFAHLDRDLADLVAALDARAGADGWALVLTSDHGGPSSPERRRAAGLAGARLTFDDVRAVAEQAAAAATGQPGPWIANTRPPYVYLDARADALPADQRARLVDAIAAALRAMPGLAGAWPIARHAGACGTRSVDERPFCLSIDLERSGDLLYSPAEGTAVVDGASPDTVTHGSVHPYDRDVPLVVVEPGVRGGRRGVTVSSLQVAPTLGRLLRVAAPPAAYEPALGPPP